MKSQKSSSFPSFPNHTDFRIFITGEVCMLGTKSNDKFNHWNFHLQICNYNSLPYVMQTPVSPLSLSLSLSLSLGVSFGKFSCHYLRRRSYSAYHIFIYAFNLPADCFKRRDQCGTPSTVMCSQRITRMMLKLD